MLPAIGAALPPPPLPPVAPAIAPSRIITVVISDRLALLLTLCLSLCLSFGQPFGVAFIVPGCLSFLLTLLQPRALSIGVAVRISLGEAVSITFGIAGFIAAVRAHLVSSEPHNCQGNDHQNYDSNDLPRSLKSCDSSLRGS